MNKRMQTKPAHTRQRVAHVAGEGAAVEDDMWCWGVIFTAAAITALCVAVLFGVGTL